MGSGSLSSRPESRRIPSLSCLHCGLQHFGEWEGLSEQWALGCLGVSTARVSWVCSTSGCVGCVCSCCCCVWFAALSCGRRAFSCGPTVFAFWGHALLSARIPLVVKPFSLCWLAALRGVACFALILRSFSSRFCLRLDFQVTVSVRRSQGSQPWVLSACL